MSIEGRCLKCGELVKRSQAAWRIDEGYEVAHDTGGPNQIRYKRRAPNMVWHQTAARPCLDDWVKEQAGQEQLQL
jgi:hypothetical protein